MKRWIILKLNKIHQPFVANKGKMRENSIK